MKNKLIFLVSVICIALFASVATYAANPVSENPKVKIVINGTMSKYSKTPVTYNGRTMLPFREVLVNLGVPNDDQHIAWNGKQRTVTLNKDSVIVVLKIGSKSATVNGKTEMLDVEPIIHKGSTYIPARFVAQALGKKVIWDGSSKSVIIRDESSFNEIKAIMDKSDNASKNISKMKANYDADIKTSAEGETVSMKMSGSIEMDIKNLVIHMKTKVDMEGLPESEDANISGNESEFYVADNKSYTNNPITGKWIYNELSKEDFMKQFSQTGAVDANDAVCAGLVAADSKNPDEIVLKGNIYLDELFAQITDSFKGLGMEITNCYMEMVLDKNTYLPKGVKMDMSMAISQELAGNNETSSVDMSMNYTYTDYNGNFEVKVPDDIVKNATAFSLDLEGLEGLEEQE